MRYLLFLLLLISSVTYSQSNVDFRGDSARFYKNGGSMEVVIRNSTKDSTNGILVNTGNGVTSFLKLRVSNDSLFLGNTFISLIGSSGNDSTYINFDLPSGYVIVDGDTTDVNIRQYLQDSVIYNQFISKESKSAWIDRLRADSIFAAVTSKDQILYAGTSGKILGNANFTRDSANGFISIKHSSNDGLGIYRTTTPAAGNQVTTLLFGSNLSGGYNDYAEIRAYYEGNGTTRQGRLVMATRGPDATSAFPAQFYGGKTILGANQPTTPFGSSYVTIRSNGVSNSPGTQSPLSVTNLDSTYYWSRYHITGRTSFGKSADNGVGKLQVGGKLTVDTVSTGSASDSILVITGTEVKKVSPVDFGGGTGTVTSVASGYGLSGGPITGTGTLAVDTSLLATRLRLQKVVDSLGALLGLVSESSTSIKGGTGTAFHSTPTGGTIFGQSSSVTGINSNVFGYNSKAGQSSISIGANIYNGATPIGLNIILSKDITTTKVGQQYEVVIGQTVTLANGYGNIHIGSDHNVTSSNPSNASNNKGVHIGMGISRASASYTGGVLIGRNINGRNANNPIIVASDPVTSANIQESVGIGHGVQLLDGQPNVVVIGRGAKSNVDATYGSDGGSQVAIGDSAMAGAWRAVAVGGRAQALAVSTTVSGYGAYSNSPHGAVYGRGAYSDKGGSVLLYGGGNATTDYYFGGVAAKWLNPAMPSGGEAVDFSADLNAGNKIARLMGVSGRDATASPSLTNTRGGHIRLMGGWGTGTAQGGDVQLAVSLAGGSSNNTENAETVRVTLSAANGNLGVGTTTPVNSAALEVSSTTKGFLPPRMTGTEAEAISSPAEGLMIYCTNGNGTTITSKGWWGFDGSAWVKLN